MICKSTNKATINSKKNIAEKQKSPGINSTNDWLSKAQKTTINSKLWDSSLNAMKSINLSLTKIKKSKNCKPSSPPSKKKNSIWTTFAKNFPIKTTQSECSKIPSKPSQKTTTNSKTLIKEKWPPNNKLSEISKLNSKPWKK